MQISYLSNAATWNCNASSWIIRDCLTVQSETASKIMFYNWTPYFWLSVQSAAVMYAENMCRLFLWDINHNIHDRQSFYLFMSHKNVDLKLFTAVLSVFIHYSYPSLMLPVFLLWKQNEACIISFTTLCLLFVLWQPNLKMAANPLPWILLTVNKHSSFCR